MPCPELEQLRAQATKISHELKERREVARQNANSSRENRSAHKNDYERYLQRRLLKASSAIEQHIASHGCQQ